MPTRWPCTASAPRILPDKPLFDGDRRGVPRLHRRRQAGRPQRRLRHRLPQCRARAARPAAGRAGRVVDTLALARRKHPMGPNSLDALCRRYGIDNSRRTKHGALLDSELLAEVYVELIGGKQAALGLEMHLAGERRGDSLADTRSSCSSRAQAAAAAADERGACRPRRVRRRDSARPRSGRRFARGPAALSDQLT